MAEIFENVDNQPNDNSTTADDEPKKSDSGDNSLDSQKCETEMEICMVKTDVSSISVHFTDDNSKSCEDSVDSKDSAFNSLESIEDCQSKVDETAIKALMSLDRIPPGLTPAEKTRWYRERKRRVLQWYKKHPENFTLLHRARRETRCMQKSMHLQSVDDLDDGEEGVSKQLRMLSFANPGKFMEDFDPERSAREMRKMNRRIYRENVRKNQLYDDSGLLLENSQDLCDCLDVDCVGCHFPCQKCGSEKCGQECRCNRKWSYEYVEIEGTNVVIKWPFFSNTINNPIQ